MRMILFLFSVAASGLIGCEDESDGDVSFGDEGGDTGAVGAESGGDGGGGAAAAYGPDNSWHHVMDDEIPADLGGSGYGQGNIANNFTMIDQFGDDVELYQFYGQVIALDVFAEW
jgi:hypothetical protein